MTHAHARATLTRYYIYAFIGSLHFTWSTWLAYVLAHGGNPGWAESAYHLAILLGEVPTGAVADLLGRRPSMLVGLALSLASSLGYFWIHDTLTACLVVGLAGLATTFHSGASTALLYETAEFLGGAEYARQSLARTNAIRLAAMTIAPAVAGFLFQWRDWAPFAANAMMVVLTFAVVWGMVEKREDAPEERRTVWSQAGIAMRTIAGNRPVLTMIVFTWIYNTVCAMAGQFGQAYFPAVGLTMGLTGLIFAVGTSTSSLGSSVASRLDATGAARMFRFAPLLVAAGYLAMGPGGVLLGIAGFLIAQTTDGFLYPVIEARLNEQIPNDQRATILSIQSAGFSMLMTVTFPAASYLPTIPMIYTVVGAVAVPLALIWMLRRWSY